MILIFLSLRTKYCVIDISVLFGIKKSHTLPITMKVQRKVRIVLL
jgi:hypothetical protein